MFTEQMELRLNALTARLIVAEGEIERLKALITPVPLTKGTAGTLTSANIDTHKPIIGYVTPSGTDVNVRHQPKIAENVFRKLLVGTVEGVREQVFVVTSMAGGKSYIWHELEGGGFVREDVVTFSKDKPAPVSTLPTKWPAPVSGYTITNTHLNANGHKGIDYACARGTPVYAAPVPGVVVKTFRCTKCDPNGNYGDYGASKGTGYGTYAIVRYAWQTGYVYVLYGHLSRLDVEQGQELTGVLGGQAIGLVGATGNTYGNPPDHLHVEAGLADTPDAKWGTVQSNQINPALLFRA